MITEILIYTFIIIIIIIFTFHWHLVNLFSDDPGSYFSQGVPDLLLVD